MAGKGTFKKLYPSNKRLFFDGGLVTKFEKSLLPDNASPDCANVVFDNGAVATRDGFSKLNATAMGSFAVDGLYTRHDNDTNETMVAFGGGHMFYWNASSFVTVPSAQSVFTAGVRVATVQQENYMFIGNGGVTPYKYDGSLFTRHGVPAASGAVSAACNAAGTLTGDYRYQVTYVNTAVVEGDVGTATATLAVAGGRVTLTALPTAPTSHGVNARKIYRTESSGTVFKLLTTINDNSTTEYTDNSSDSELGANAPTDNGEPPNYDSAVYFNGRLFVNDPNNRNYVWYSELFQPYTFPSTNFIRIGDNASDLVSSLAVYEYGVVVLCENSTHIIYQPSQTDTEWVVVRSKGAYGSKSPYGAFNFNNSLMFPAIQNDKFLGFAGLTGDQVQAGATQLTIGTSASELLSNNIEPDMFDVQESALKNISSTVFKNKAYITLQKDSGSTENNYVYVFDFSVSNLNRSNEFSWVPWTGLSASQFTILDGVLHYGSSLADGFVYKQVAGQYNDDGSAINSYFWTKEFSGFEADSGFHKDFRYLTMIYDLPGTYFMNLKYRTNSDTGSGNVRTIDLDPGGSVWGTMVWGVDKWGGGNSQGEDRFSLRNARGKRIQFRFDNQNTADQRFKVHGIRFTYNNKGLR